VTEGTTGAAAPGGPPEPRAVALARRMLPRPAFEVVRRVGRGGADLLEQHVVPRLFGARVRHVAGPRAVDYGPDEVLAISIVRDGEAHIRSFIEHHLAIGVRHIVLLDNGSVDRTVEVARGYDAVSVFHTDATYHRWENVMKRHLARRFSTGRWNLMVDVDERFDYPFSDVLPLRDLVGYLNRHDYTALVAHMVDRFPDAELAAFGGAVDGDIEDAHAYFDLSAVRPRAYRWGTPDDPRIREYKGGVRHALFGVDCGLTKAPLVRVDRDVHLFVGWHHTRNARIADLDSVLWHFPFVGFHAKVRTAVDAGRYGEFSPFYAQYDDVLKTRPDLRPSTATTRRSAGATALLDDGFLVASPRFVAWARSRQPRPAAAAS